MYHVEAAQTLSRSRFTIGLSLSGRGSPSFEQLTKRATLISDTLLLSHDWTGRFHDLGVRVWSDQDRPLSEDEGIGRLAEAYLENLCPAMSLNPAVPNSFTAESESRIKSSDSVEVYGMHCPNLARLGRWILDAKPLLTAGLAWYLPSYSIVTRTARDGQMAQRPVATPERLQAIDYLIRDGRAVDASGAEPIKES